MAIVTASSISFRGRVRDDYLALIQKFPLTSIRSDTDLQSAQRIMDQLLTKDQLSSGEAMYLDALSDLVGAFEDEHYQIGPASDSAMLGHLMETKGVTQAELHRDTGIAKSAISEVLTGKKKLSRTMIRTFAAYFDVDTSLLAANI